MRARAASRRADDGRFSAARTSGRREARTRGPGLPPTHRAGAAHGGNRELDNTIQMKWINRQLNFISEDFVCARRNRPISESAPGTLQDWCTGPQSLGLTRDFFFHKSYRRSRVGLRNQAKCESLRLVSLLHEDWRLWNRASV